MTLPLADFGALAGPGRRTRALRLVLVAGLGVVAGILVWTLPSAGPVVAATDARSGVVAVLDVSGSVSGGASPVVRAALERVIRQAGPHGAGFVLFSDVAQEALPPGTPTDELHRFLRYLPSKPLHAGQEPSINPWSPSFSSGTAISSGIAEARRMLRGPGRIVLISDLEDAPTDLTALRRQLLAVARTPGIDVQVLRVPDTLSVGANPSGSYVDSLAPQVERIVRDTVPPARRSVGAAAATGGRASSSFPAGPALAIALIAVLLAAAELVAMPLRWRRRTA